MWLTGTTVKLLQKTTVKTVARTALAPQHIQWFFAKYPTFDFQANAPFLEEFKRLCKHTKWERTKAISKEGWEKVAKDRQRAKKRAKRALKTAMVAQFNQMYGRDANDLASWQHLCNALGVKPLPTKIAACKRLVTNTHVNLVDFIQAPDPEKPVPTFSSEDALSAYTRSARKFFPRGDIKAGSLLRCLLRHIRDD